MEAETPHEGAELPGTQAGEPESRCPARANVKSPTSGEERRQEDSSCLLVSWPCPADELPAHREILSQKVKVGRASKMTQGKKVLATQPHSLNSIARTFTVEEENLAKCPLT